MAAVFESEKDIEGLKRIGGIVSDVLQFMVNAARPGMTTRDLDAIGAKQLKDRGAESAPILTYNFPGSTCISVNHEAAHGVPGQKVLKAGDLVNIDISAALEGYFGDTGASFVLAPRADNPKDQELLELCDATRAVLKAAMGVVKHGTPLNMIGKTIDSEARRMGYTIIRNLCSHGVGRSLHDEPKEILPYYNAKDKRVLKKGMVITIEPFVSTGADWVDALDDGWTLVTSPKYRTAQFEHTMIVEADGVSVMTKDILQPK